jgi:hypothetical protein
VDGFAVSIPAAAHTSERYAQCRWTGTVLRTLALLLAAHSSATPKQAKEPIIQDQREFK